MELLKKLRQQKGLYQKDVASFLGIDRTTYVKYETGASEPDYKMLSRLADFYEVSIDELLGRDTAPRFDPSQNWIPVLDDVAAGIPILAIENFDSDDPDDWEQLDERMARNVRHIALRINGDSMEPRMKKGDVVIVRVQPTIENGEIAVVKVNGDDATCKKIKKTPQGLTLISLNPSYEPMFYTAEECAELPVTIIGKVVELRAKF